MIIGNTRGFIRGYTLATLNDLNNKLDKSALSNYYTKDEVDALIDVAYPTYRWNKYYPYRIATVSNQSIVAPDNDNQDGCYYFNTFPQVEIGTVSTNYATTYSRSGYQNFRSSDHNLSSAQATMIGKYAWDPDDRYSLRRVVLVNRVNTGGSGFYLYGTAYNLSETVTQGEFIETIESPNPAMYPNNGYDPNTGFWYVLQ